MKKVSFSRFSLQTKFLLAGVSISVFTSAGILITLLILSARTGGNALVGIEGGLVGACVAMVFLSSLAAVWLAKTIFSPVKGILHAALLIKDGCSEKVNQESGANQEEAIATLAYGGTPRGG
jgi:hypothetical protein